MLTIYLATGIIGGAGGGPATVWDVAASRSAVAAAGSRRTDGRLAKASGTE